MPQDGRPDLRHAQAWLEEIRADLYAARTALGMNDNAAYRKLAVTLEGHAATLGDIIARANIVPRDRIELPTVEQANALARRGASVKLIAHRPFDLPADYLLVEYEDGFTCGIAPDGSVSS